VHIDISHAGNRFASRAVRVATLLVVAAFVFGGVACATGPPVQEMSDARQAISVAREAGAATAAPDELREAETLLESAQRNLAGRAYAQARRDAMQAKEKALLALASVERPE
jgi:hypothetical protein